MPTYLCKGEPTLWPKALGCGENDLGAGHAKNEKPPKVNLEPRHDGLWGVYRFKRGFGGEVKRAAQAMDRIYNPLLYWAYLKYVGNRE